MYEAARNARPPAGRPSRPAARTSRSLVSATPRIAVIQEATKRYILYILFSLYHKYFSVFSFLETSISLSHVAMSKITSHFYISL